MRLTSNDDLGQIDKSLPSLRAEAGFSLYSREVDK